MRLMQFAFRCLLLALALQACSEPQLREPTGELPALDDAGAQDGGADPAVDAGPEAPEPLLPFQDDFERADGPISGGPWQRSSTGIAEIWDGRLCVAEGGEAVLALPPARYRYVRFDVPSARGLQIQAQASDGTMFSLHFRDEIVSGQGAKVAEQGILTVAALEAEISYESRTVRLGIRQGAYVELPFAGNVAGKELASLRFSIEPSEGATLGPGCLDNLYVAPEVPTTNPFLHSPGVNACVPLPGLEERCIAKHCCPTSCFCPVEEPYCSCDIQAMQACAADCIRHDNSGGFDRCASTCARMGSWNQALLEVDPQCIDTHCAVAPRELEPNLTPVTWPADPPALHANARAFYRITSDSIHGIAIKLEHSDFANTNPEHIGTLMMATGERLTVHAEPTHTRFVAFMHDPEYGFGTVATWTGSEFRTLSFPEVGSNLIVSPSLRYLYVRTLGGDRAIDYLLGYDGSVLDRWDVTEVMDTNPYLDGALFANDESYALLYWQNATYLHTRVVDFVTGTVSAKTEQKEPGLWSEPLWAFAKGVVWHEAGGDAVNRLRWSALDGASSLEPLPTNPIAYDRKFVVGDEGLFVAGRDGPKRVAALPLDHEPLAVSDTHVLARKDHALVLLDTAGATVASHDVYVEGETSLAEVYPYGPERGLFVAGHTDASATVHAFAVEGGTFSVSTVHWVAMGSNGMHVPYRISQRPDASTVLIHDGDFALFDVLSQQTLAETRGPDVDECPGRSCIVTYASPPVYWP